MLTQQRSKKKSKFNRKKKVIESETGLEFASKQNQLRPILFLPEITTSPIFSVIRRFVNNGGAVSGSLQISDLLNQFLYATGATTSNTYVRAVRLKRVRILTPVTTQGTSVLLKLQPVSVDTANNSFNAVSETYLDTSASIDIPAYIKLHPSIDTPLGAWHYNTTGNANLLNIVCPTGSTMDLTLDFILNDQSAPSGFTATIAGGSAGQMFSRAILTNFLPQTLQVY